MIYLCVLILFIIPLTIKLIFRLVWRWVLKHPDKVKVTFTTDQHPSQ